MTDLERTLDQLWETVLKKHAVDLLRELEAQPAESTMELLGKLSLSINSAIVHLLAAEMYVHSWMKQVESAQDPEPDGEAPH